MQEMLQECISRKLEGEDPFEKAKPNLVVQAQRRKRQPLKKEATVKVWKEGSIKVKKETITKIRKGLP